jgi:succinate dehydrogenase/fumarate reductase cytochrome b subunit
MDLARKIIGILVCLIGILIGAVLTTLCIGIALAFWGAPENPGQQGNMVWGIAALIGALIGFGIYKLGRWIAG